MNDTGIVRIFKILRDLRLIGVRDVRIDARHRALIVANADAGLEVAREPDQVLAAEREGVEVLHLEKAAGCRSAAR